MVQRTVDGPLGHSATPSYGGRRRAPCLIRLVGGFRVEGAKGQPSVAGQRVLAYLALRGLAQRSAIASALWPTASEANASGSLRSTLWRLRRVGDLVDHHPTGTLALASSVSVDAVHCRDWARRLDAGELAGHELNLDRVPRGELLSGWDEDWIHPERERFDHMRLAALEAMAGLCAGGGRLVEATEAALRAIEIDPLRESALRLLIQIYARQGAQRQAQVVFERYRSLLNSEIGVEPSPELRRLVEDMTRPGSASHRRR